MTESGKHETPKRASDILAQISSVFGPNCCNNTSNGRHGWYWDQRLASLRIHQWKTQTNQSSNIYIYSRQLHADRLDRVKWRTIRTPQGIVDSHILQYCYDTETWRELRSLLMLMHTNVRTMQWCDQYAARFHQFKQTCWKCQKSTFHKLTGNMHIVLISTQAFPSNLYVWWPIEGIDFLINISESSLTFSKVTILSVHVLSFIDVLLCSYDICNVLIVYTSWLFPEI